MNKIYFFDFDGTITEKDSFLLFTFYSVSKKKYILYWLRTIILYPILSKSRLKEYFFNHFKCLDLSNFNIICNSFSNKKINNTIKESFLNLSLNSEVVIVSASISNYLKPWCDEMGFDLISTELEVKDGKLTGKFSTPNCNGDEKVRRIKEKYDLSLYDEIHVFGNSKGDFPMLELGTHKYYKFFK
jgi:phosphatidylglycerophosphatase C